MNIASHHSSICCICGGTKVQHRHGWLSRCTKCGFLSSTLDAQLNFSTGQLDEQKRQQALQALRRENFEIVLDCISTIGLPVSARILDVGCGHGWFVLAAMARGHHALGIEPDRVVADMARTNGVDVRRGFFPDAVGPEEKFDLIIFNDVFEHLPDPLTMLTHVRSHLSPSGLVAINLPLATGMIYRCADALDRLGIHGPFARMWQVGFPSPHRCYFTAAQLATLAYRIGLRERLRISLPSMRIAGLWQRIRYDRNHGIVLSLIMWPILAALAPVLRYLPPDIGLQVFSASQVENWSAS